MAEGEKRVRLSDEDFFEIWENVAESDTPTIKEVARLSGLKEASVIPRKGVFNRKYKEKGLALTPFPRASGNKRDIDETAKALLAMRAKRQEAKMQEEVPQEAGGSTEEPSTTTE